MLQFSTTKAWRVAAVAALVVALYAVAGFVIAPPLLRSALLKDIPKSIDATVTVGSIRINPFLLQLSVEDFTLSSLNGDKLLGFQRLFIDFELSSIWHRAYSFANITLTAPHVSALVAPGGVLNLLQLRPKSAAAATPDEKVAALPPLRIGVLKVVRGLLTYEDRSRPDVFAARLEPINVELREFTSGVEGGKFTFTGVSTLGERLEWHGHVSVDPLETDGEFKVDRLLAHTLWEYLQDQVNFVVNSGSIEVAGTYRFSIKDPATDNLVVNVSRVSVRDLSVLPKTAAGAVTMAPWISVPEFAASGGILDLTKHHAHVDQVTLSGVKLLTWLAADGRLNLLQLATSPGAAQPGAAQPLSASGTPLAWTFDVGHVEIRDASIATEDRSTNPVVKVTLAPLALQVDGISQDMSKPLKVTLDTRINDKGSLSLKGAVTPQPAQAEVSLQMTDIDLTAAQPYLAQHTAMTLQGGKLGGELQLHYAAQPAASVAVRQKTPAVRLTGNIHIDAMHSVDDDLHDDFINWERLDILGLNYTRGPDRLDIDQLVARKLYARVILESDESLNFKRVLKMSADPTTLASAATPAASAPAAAAMPMSIKKVVLKDSQANFTDLSLLPNFAAGIHQLEGTVVGLSSQPASRATVNFKGAVDTYSPVSITGEVNVLGPLYVDLAIGFRNISLPVLNPYSGKFAGYNITKGKLSSELHYKVAGRMLDAQHHIVVDQLEFGDKTESKKAVSLPVKLAVALLKDRNGVIDLDIPVNGSLDDPQFHLAPIIWKVFVNVLERAVSAPFALLGALFGGGPALQFIEFQPGLATLDAAAQDKVKAVAKALSERPQLRIDVPIAVVAAVDRPALVAVQFAAHLKAARAATQPTFDQLDALSQLELLRQVYVTDLGAEPVYPEAVSALQLKPASVSAKIAFLDQGIREHIVVTDFELEALGQSRAVALQQALLADPQVAPERVFLVANDKAVAKNNLVELELSLK